MFGAYAKSHFVSILAARAANVDDNYSTYNGTNLQVDMSKPRDYISEENKIIISNTGTYDLPKNIAMALWHAGAKNSPLGEVTEDVLESAGDKIAQNCCVWSILNAMNHAGVRVTLRSSDATDLPFPARVGIRADHADEVVAPAVVDPPLDNNGGGDPERANNLNRVEEEEEGAERAAEDNAGGVAVGAEALAEVAAEAVAAGEGDRPIYMEIPEGGLPADYIVTDHPILKFARKMITYFFDTDDRIAQEKLVSESQFIILAIIAVAIHRKLAEGHSWFSKKGVENATVTNRITRIAGAVHEEFAKWMRIHGHDVWHFLDDNTIDAIANALTGKNSTGEEEAVSYSAPFRYMGIDCNGKSVKEVFRLSEAAIDRWPTGVLGKSAIILGIGEMRSMVQAITTRVLVEGATHVSGALNTLAGTVLACNRDMVVKIKRHMEGSIAFACGYNRPVAAEYDGGSPSLDALCKRKDSDYKNGKHLSIAVMNAPTHETALATAILTALNNMADTINATMASEEGYTPAEHATRAEIGESETARSHARMMQLMGSEGARGGRD